MLNIKPIFLNYILMMSIILILVMLQNSINFSVLNTPISFYLWIPCLIYWGLYRRIEEATFIVYFITLSVAASSSVHFGLLAVCNSLMLIIFLLFKRIYYKSWMFFTVACAVALFFFPLLIWTLARMIGDKVYLPGILPWFLGGMLTWLISFLILALFQWIDKITFTSLKENQKLGVL